MDDDSSIRPGTIAEKVRSGIARLLSDEPATGPSYVIASSLFARVISVIYLIAFMSFGKQVRGLIGNNGIQPVTEFLGEVSRQFGSSGFWKAPTVFWWTHSELALEVIIWSGAVIAGVSAIGRPHTPGQKGALVLLYIYYLSAVTGGQIFMGYQWDYLLLEAGFLTIFLKPVFIRVWLFRWLLFRLMFESGLVKLFSHDPTWRNLTALSYHYETQPLPTPVAWYMYQLPLWFQKISTASVFVVELGFPFLIFGTRRMKQIAAAGIVSLQLLIMLTGNYTFFNLLAIALCVFLLDDALLSRWFAPLPQKENPGRSAFRFGRRGREPVAPLRANRYVSGILALMVLIISLTQLARMSGIGPGTMLSQAIAPVAPFGLVNEYGLFAVMTTTRPEISIEGSNDGVNWQPYLFRYKPGPLNRRPPVIEPSQPRLDWQMWFAALGGYQENPWLLRFMMKLLEGSIPVLELIGENPFPDKPPKYIHALVYEYHFTTYAERRATGNWWKRELKGVYFPPIALRGNQ